MNIKTGCDIVEIKRFEKLGDRARDKIFSRSEMKNSNAERLAGIFAAKESCRKVFNDLGWHDIEVKKKRDGKPMLVINTDKEILSHDLSISHDGDYAIANVVFLFDGD